MEECLACRGRSALTEEEAEAWEEGQWEEVA